MVPCGKVRGRESNLVYLIGLVVFVLDQVIKWIVASHVAVDTGFPILHGVLEILYVRNTGAAFSLLTNQRIILVVIAVIVVMIVIFVDRKFAIGKLSLQIPLGMLLGGAVGNLFDRVVHGYVIDYVYVQAIHFPVFNLADSAIVVAMILLVIRSWKTPGTEVLNKGGDDHESKTS